MNWYYHTKIGINIPLFWKNIVKMTPVAVIMGTGAWFGLEYLGMDSWLEFFTYAVIYTIVYFALAYVFVMNTYEKNLFFGIVKKLIAKIQRRKE